MRDQQAGAKPNLVLKGGHVVDPANGISAQLDVELADGLIAQVAPELRPAADAQVLDVTGYYVTPGLVDIHVHCFHKHRASSLSLPPEVQTFQSGCTTVVDAGTSGWRDFGLFKEEVIDRAKIRVLAFVNVAGGGMNDDYEQNVREMEPRMAAAVAMEYPDLVVGIKSAHYWVTEPFDAEHPPWASVDAGLEAAQLCRKPLMVDFWPRLPERPYDQLLLEKLRPGDIHTHVFGPHFPIIDQSGAVYDYMFQARERGVRFDMGHGAGSFVFRNAYPAIQQGFIPDTISTDLHTGSYNGAMRDMQNVMSKVLSFGVPLEDVIARSTVAPARLVGQPQLGTLSVGSGADVAIFELREGTFGFADIRGARFTGERKLTCVATIMGGEVVFNPTGLGLPDWKSAPAKYYELLVKPD